MSDIRKMIVRASGLIEFIDDVEEPEGSIHVCTARGSGDIAALICAVTDESILHNFDDVTGLRVPGIDPTRAAAKGVDVDAVDALIEWEDRLRDDIGDDNAIEWTRS